MKIPTLFNPSNDMALAANVRQYFPPRRIQQMEEDLQGLSRLWDEGPWGWSLATKQRYLRMGITESDLPSDEWLAEVRRLSGRAFAVEYHKKMSSQQPSPENESLLLPCKARFCKSMASLPFGKDETQKFICKAPWSSSGRGNFIVNATTASAPTFQSLVSESAILQRIERIIRDQGGIVVEPFYEGKALDFAMEFWVSDQGTKVLGYSVFEADEMGHYCGNYVESQEALTQRINLPADLLRSLIDYHKQQLSTLSYRGPVGIDMMKLSDGRVHPLVEINFRMTMGLLALMLFEKGIRADQFLTPNRTHGFVSSIRQGRLVIDYLP